MPYRRRTYVAGRFYPENDASCRRELKEYTQFDAGAVAFDHTPRAGIVPHAGWVFSGGTAGKVFACIRARALPKVFILLGAAHRLSGNRAAIMTDGSWDTPLGDLPVDKEAAGAIVDLAGDALIVDAQLHEAEHSIEVQTPFIKFLFPNASFVPILAPPGGNALKLGEAVGKYIAGRAAGEAVAVASADLTHYGAEYGFAPKGAGEESLRWVREVNDKRFIDNALAFDGEKIIEDAERHHNTCGAGAAAAAVIAAHGAGSRKGALIEYTTSHDVMPRGVPSMFVGYAGMIF